MIIKTTTGETSAIFIDEDTVITLPDNCNAAQLALVVAARVRHDNIVTPYIRPAVSLRGWSTSLPASDGNPCWVTQAVANGSGTTAIIPEGSWNTPVKMVEDGITPDISIGTVSTLDPGSQASASMTGTPAAPVLNLGIPSGLTGNGIRSIAKTGTAGLVDTYTVTYTNGTTMTFTVTNGANGEITASSLADTFSASASYTAGKCVVYAGQLYQFSADHAAGAWTGTDATAIKLADVVSDLNNAISAITQENYGENIFDGLFPESGSINATGQEVDSSSYVRTGYIPIDNTQSKLYILRDNAPYLLNARFYSGTTTDSFVSAWAVFSANTIAIKTNDTIPQTANFVRFVRPTSESGYIDVTYTETNTEIPYYPPYVSIKDESISEKMLDSELQEKINAKSFTGKKIAFFGDSIVGNFNDSTGVCSQIAEKTGATVINCAFGGSRMAYEYSKYGDATPGATGYIDGATAAQKNQVDQYRYWNTLSGYGLAQAISTGTWTMQEYAVANMASGLNYFSARLIEIEAIDWSTIDYILWEYGTNDFSTKVMLSDATDTTNLFAFDNAYRQTIETISTAYPNIQIIPITPTWRFWEDSGAYLYDSNTHTMNDYEDTSRLLTAFVAKAQEIAREYQLPFIDDYYTLGANKFTRSAFFDATDGVHPNANGRTRIAEHIASQLDSVV